MAERNSNVFSPRTFGFNFIRWKIGNFCFKTSNKRILISTPEIYVAGSYPTKWKLTLKPKVKLSGKYYFAVSLNRIRHGDGPDCATVDMRICIADYKNERSCFVPYSAKMENEDAHLIYLASVNEIRRHLEPLFYEPGEFWIHCLLLVNFEESYKNGDVPIDSALKSLSENLENLYHAETDYDVVLKIKGQEIHAHRAVLCCRSEHFAGMIGNETRDTELDLSYLDYSAVSNVVEYVYSGNIECIAKNASISTFDVVSHFKIPCAQSYFKPQEIDVCSVIECNVFRWCIKRFSEISTDRLLCHKSIRCNDTKWVFYIYSKYESPEGIHIFMFADYVQGTVQNDCHFLFRMEDESDVIWVEEFGMINNKSGRLRFHKFFSDKKADIKPKKSIREMTVEFLIFTNVHSSTIKDNSRKNGDYCFPIIEHYLCLSNDLKKMENGKYCDVVLKAIGNTFRVPKCVLSARSPLLKLLLREMRRGKRVYLNVKSNILKKVLLFIYTGFCEDFVDCDISELYKAAKDLSLPGLIKTLPESIFQEGTPWDIAEYAIKHNDDDLLDSIRNFIVF